MNVNGTLEAMPSSFSLIGGDDVSAEGISSSLTIAQEWDGGFNALLEIVNNGETIYLILIVMSRNYWLWKG